MLKIYIKYVKIKYLIKKYDACGAPRACRVYNTRFSFRSIVLYLKILNLSNLIIILNKK